MSDFGELLASNQPQTLQFFFTGLKDVSGSNANTQELLYNANVLAHYSQVSTASQTGWPTPGNLSAVFDHFVADFSLLQDGQMMETAGAQCLLLSGFFEDQMRHRHNIGWYAKLGAGFLMRAAFLEKSKMKIHLLYRISNEFEIWRQRHARLSRELRDRPYLLLKPS